jgi:hypothetical protein
MMTNNLFVAAPDSSNTLPMEYKIQWPYFRVRVRDVSGLDSHEKYGLRLSIGIDLQEKIMVFDWREVLMKVLMRESKTSKGKIYTSL